VLPYQHFSLTALLINVPRGAQTRVLQKKWDVDETQKKWEDTTQFKKLHTRGQRSQNNDFERFILGHLKKRVIPIWKALIEASLSSENDVRFGI
jgi:ribosomal protein L14E/L6E/L27E